MTFTRHQRTPLGALYRSPLGAFGPGVAEGPPPSDVQIDPSSATVNLNFHYQITSDCRFVTDTDPLIANGYTTQSLVVSLPDRLSYTAAQWLTAVYTQGALSYDLSALTVESCFYVEPPPFGQYDIQRYAGLNSIAVGDSSAHDIVAFTQDQQNGNGIVSIVFAWNHIEWPTTFFGSFDSNELVDVAFTQ